MIETMCFVPFKQPLMGIFYTPVHMQIQFRDRGREGVGKRSFLTQRQRLEHHAHVMCLCEAGRCSYGESPWIPPLDGWNFTQTDETMVWRNPRGLQPVYDVFTSCL